VSPATVKPAQNPGQSDPVHFLVGGHQVVLYINRISRVNYCSSIGYCARSRMLSLL